MGRPRRFYALCGVLGHAILLVFALVCHPEMAIGYACVLLSDLGHRRLQ